MRADNQGYCCAATSRSTAFRPLLDYRKARGEPEAEVRIAATLDEAARAQLGFDLGAYVSGPMPIKINGRVPLEAATAAIRSRPT